MTTRTWKRMTTTRTRVEPLIARRERAIGYVAFGIVLFICLIALGCVPNESILKSNRETPTTLPAAPIPDSFEKDLAAMNEVDFTWVYVLRRKDGGKMDAADKAFIGTNTSDANRRVLSDGDKAVIVGTNYIIGDANLKALKDRFDFRDLSPNQQSSPTPTTK